MTYVSTMTAAARPAFVERSSRKPLSVQVVTRPALRGCWSVNISHSGIGLVARPRGPHDGPREGEQNELNVVVAFAGEREAAVVRQALEGVAQPLFAHGPEEVEQLVGRGDASALVIFGDRTRARALVDRLAGRGLEQTRRWGEQPRDL